MVATLAFYSTRRNRCAGRWRQSLNVKPAALNVLRYVTVERITYNIYITGCSTDATNVQLRYEAALRVWKHAEWSQSWREKTGHLTRSETAAPPVHVLLFGALDRFAWLPLQMLHFSKMRQFWFLKGSLNIKNKYRG